MKIIGLTGGIASGKSSVALYLSSLGAKVADADQVSAQVLEEEKYRLPEIFGSEALKNGSIDKVYLRQEIFKNPEKKKQLETLVHQKVKEVILSQLAKYQQDGGVSLLVVEVPLLFEAGWQEMFDEVWTVSAPKDVRVNRLLKRSGIDEVLAEKIMAGQLSDKEREAKADLTINNETGLPELKVLLEKLYQEYGL